MAYGVKYRLEFVDDNLKGKKIEILKDGYSGSVLALTGTNDPLSIEWSGNDDFYDPIVGSTCTINLFDTDTSNYDNFYEFDEREYKIIVYYKDSGGSYQIYWQGWLLTDQFKKAVTTKPFGITLKGYDGLGSLKGFSAPIDLTSVATKDLMYYIHTSLSNLDLGLDIYVSNDIQKDGASGSDYTFYDQITVSQKVFLKDGVDLRTAKDVLGQILRFSNARIFQSYGKWYIINNSSYSEQSVKDSSATTANGGTIPTGIRAAETSSLQSNGTESVKYFIYNSSGVYQSTSTVNVLSVVPTNLQPLDNNLTKEYLRPLKEFTMEADMGGFFDNSIIVNGGFEHAATAWTLTNSSIVTDFMFQGDRCVKSTTCQTTSGATSVVVNNSSGIDEAASSSIAYKLKINTYFNSTSGNTRGFRFQLKLVETGPGASQTKYWSETSNNWVTADTKNDVEVDTNIRWKSFDFDIATLPFGGDMTLYLYGAYQTTSTSGFTAIFFDSLRLDRQNIDSDGNRTELFEEFDFLQNLRQRTVDVSGVKKLEVFLTNKFYGRISGSFYRSRDKTNYLKSVEEIITQQVMNDFRDFVVRYEGDLYNNSNDPIAMQNKVWVNFGSGVLQEPVSCYLDSITYNVKRNLYSVVMHIPNQNDDVTTSFLTKF
jgi:hypothetical protein